MLAPPYYSLPTAPELTAHFAAVDKAIDIPIMLYNYPARTGVDLTPDLVEELAELKKVAYIKESTGDCERIREIIDRCRGNIEVFCGSDSIAFESFSLGAIGWVAGAANVFPQEHVEFYKRLVEMKDIDGAQKLFGMMLPFLHFIEGGGKYTQWVKSACAISGHPLGPPRMPLLRATEAESERLQKLMKIFKS
jgi:4-hydroxy-tetrahydrodipicolinate synthase